MTPRALLGPLLIVFIDNCAPSEHASGYANEQVFIIL